jgi:hypothetical protein
MDGLASEPTLGTAAPKLDACLSRDRGVWDRVRMADTIMRRDSFYFLFSLASLAILIGWLLFVTFAG